MTYIINNFGLEMIGLILCAILGWAGRTAKRFWMEKVNTETKRAVAYNVYRFAEQVWKDLKGEAKMQKALEKARELLAAKGIDWDAEEMRVLIEVCVSEFNTAFKAPLQDPGSAAAAYRVEQANVDEKTSNTEQECGFLE